MYVGRLFIRTDCKAHVHSHAAEHTLQARFLHASHCPTQMGKL